MYVTHLLLDRVVKSHLTQPSLPTRKRNRLDERSPAPPNRETRPPLRDAQPALPALPQARPRPLFLRAPRALRRRRARPAPPRAAQCARDREWAPPRVRGRVGPLRIS